MEGMEPWRAPVNEMEREAAGEGDDVAMRGECGAGKESADEIHREGIVIVEPDAGNPGVITRKRLGKLGHDRTTALADVLLRSDGDAAEPVRRREVIEPLPPGPGQQR